MELKIPIFWGKGDSHQVSPKFNFYFLLFFFQGSKEGGQETGEVAAVVLVGEFKPAEDCMGKLGDNLSA